MKKKYCIVLFLLFLSLLCKSQSDLSYYQNRFDIQKTSYEDISIQTFDIENTAVYTLRRNPAFMHLYYNPNDSSSIHSSINKTDTKGILSTTLSFNKVDGDYLFYDGNRKLNGAVLAGGEKTIDKLGTLYGSASLSSGRTKNTYLNMATNPLDYYPYMVGDTLGNGDINNERHEINGGFSFKHKKLFYGIGGSYVGIASSKLTDPRLSVYTSWLRLNFGVAKITQKNLYAIKIYPEFNRQRISAGMYKQKSTNYFQFYGFGAWNKDESKAGNSYNRLMTIKGLATDITYMRLSPENGYIGYTFNVVYNYRKMDTEEDSYKNLFTTVTHHFKPEIILSKRNKSIEFYLVLRGDNNFRTGTEHIYENLAVSDQKDLFDYIKVASSKQYHQRSLFNSILLKSIYNLSTSHSLHFLGEVNYDYYEEKYTAPQKRICNQSINPSIGIGYNSLFNQNRLEFNIRFAVKKATNNVFDLAANDKRVIQQAYIPYTIRGEDNNTLSSEILYSRSIGKKESVGTKLFLSYCKRTDAPFISGLQSHIDQNRKLLNINLNLFYLF